MRIAALVLAALLCGCGKPEPPAAKRVVILHTNDIHGRVRRGGGVPGLAALAATIRRLRTEAAASGARVLVVDCGDFFQGTPEGDLTKGRVVIECMNAIGYDALALGNHDFDLGPSVTAELRALARFPFLGANVVREGTRDPPAWVAPTARFEDAGIEIAGLVTSTMPSVTLKRAREGLHFLREEEALERLAWRPGLARLLATHIGVERDRELATRFRPVAILSGHSHTQAAETVDGVAILQSSCWGMLVGRLELSVRDGVATVVSMKHEQVDADTQDAQVRAIIERTTPEIDRVMDEVVGELAHELRAGARGVQESSPLGNHLTDVMRAVAGAELALHNRTGIRASLRRGTVRLRDLYTVSPFGNTIVALTLTGKQVRALIETGLRDGTRLLLEISGGEVLFDPAAEAGGRVVSITIGGEPLDPARRYRVATNSFLADGGDGHSIFANGADKRDTGIDLLQAHRESFPRGRALRVEFANRIVARAP